MRDIELVGEILLYSKAEHAFLIYKKAGLYVGQIFSMRIKEVVVDAPTYKHNKGTSTM